MGKKEWRATILILAVSFIIFFLMNIPIRADDANLELERHFRYAEDLFENRLYHEAAIEYLKLIDLFPKHKYMARARFRLGSCAFLQGAYETALKQWQRVIDEYPQSNWAKEAERMISVIRDEVGEITPKSPTDQAAAIPFANARRFEKEGRNEEALIWYQRVITDFPNTFWATSAAYRRCKIFKAEFDYAMKMYKLKLDEYRTYQKSKTAKQYAPTAYKAAAKYLETVKLRLAKAVDEYSDFIEDYATSYFVDLAHRDLAEIYRKMKMYDQAIQEYQKIIDRNIDNPYSVLAYEAKKYIQTIR